MLQVGKQKYTLISINQLDIFSVAESALQKKPSIEFLFYQKFYIFVSGGGGVWSDEGTSETLGFNLIHLRDISISSTL